MAVAAASGSLSGLGPVIPSGCSSDTSSDPLDNLQQQMGEQTMQALIALLQQVTQQLRSATNPQDSSSQAASSPSAGTVPPASTMPQAGAGGCSGGVVTGTPTGGGVPAGGTSGGGAAGTTGGSAGASPGGSAGADSASMQTGDPNGGGTDLENAMSATEAKDPTLFAKTMKDAKSGDGNSLVKDELQAYKEGDITKGQAIEEVKGAQSLANQHGGGKINGKVKDEAKSALGGSYIKGGQTRVGHAILKAFEDFTGIGAIVKGVQSKTSKSSEDILTAAQPATQQGDQKALQDMQSADPALAQKFQKDEKSGDGNAMVDDMVQLKQREQSGQDPDTFTDQDAQMLGSQVGDVGKGKVNSKEDQAFTQAFGTDTLFRGSSRGAKAFNKFEDGVGNLMQKVVSPVTDTAVGMDDLVHGNIKGAFSQFGQALEGAAEDAAMVVAPEAAPEVAAGEMAARGAADAGEAAGSAAQAGSSLGNAMNTLNDGANLLNKGNNYYNNATTVQNYLSGNNGQAA